MLKLIEIPRQIIEKSSPAAGSCPGCGGTLRKTRIPCPNGIVGCLVLHEGFRCDKCDRVFQQARA